MPSWLSWLGLTRWELLAAVLSLLAVRWTARRDMRCWPVGLVSVLLYGVIFLDAHLFSDALLQAFYAGLLAYGWWQWRRSGADAPEGVPVVRAMGLPSLAAGIGAGAACWAALGTTMSRWTHADLAWIDAGLTSYSLVAQYWVARRYRANWLLWIGLDLAYIAMYVAKGLPVTAVLYGFFVVLAVQGWRSWGRAA